VSKAATHDSATAFQRASLEVEALGRFARERMEDPRGGFLTTFSGGGRPLSEPVKTVISQARSVWTCSALKAATGDALFDRLARHGVDYLVETFLDPEDGGWYWSAEPGQGPTLPPGRPLDRGKATCAQATAIYALATFAAVFHDQTALRLADETFDAMEPAWDPDRLGYRETSTRGWRPAATEAAGRKTLVTHTQVLEALTVLASLSGESRHRERLAQVRDVIVDRMIDQATGAIGDQFAADFTPLPPIPLDRLWEGAPGTPGSPPPWPTTTYGLAMEATWQLGQAEGVLLGDAPGPAGAAPWGTRARWGVWRDHAAIVDRVAAHALNWGYDTELGGVYARGPLNGPAFDTDKIFWTNAEALVGFLHAFEVTDRAEYRRAFLGIWKFAHAHLAHPELVEWHVRADRDGNVIDQALGDRWTGGFHTTRAAIEVRERLRRLVARDQAAEARGDLAAALGGPSPHVAPNRTI
jgi:mannobiose 2-epimerase